MQRALVEWSPGDLRLRREGDGAVVAAALVAGVLADLAVRSGGAGLAGAILVAAVAGMLLAAGQPAGWQARAVVAAAALFGGFLAIRTSPWLVPLDVLAAGGLLVLGASLAGGGSLFDLPLLGWVARAVHAGLHGLAAPTFAWQGIKRVRARLAPDAVAPALGVPPPPGGGWRRCGAWPWPYRCWWRWAPCWLRLICFSPTSSISLPTSATSPSTPSSSASAPGGCLLRVAAATSPEGVPRRLPLVGSVEATVVLGSLVTLFVAFAVTQVVALAGGGRHVVETAGLTYAEYARSGFFQLVAVAVITLAVLLAVDIFTDPCDRATRRRLVALSEVCVGLTLVVVLSALRRLDLYENAYGLTMLRLYVAVFVGWVGVSLALLGVWVAAGRGRSWFPATAAGAGLVALLALNLVNPEAVVVRRNVTLAERSDRFDPGYLAELSEDAVRELVRSLPRVDPAGHAELLAHICGLPPTASGGWAAWNAAKDSATEARNRVCQQ